ncbi:GNAT family N-acetyltransferase [Oceanicola sp. 502str15]|uniref:GNAT family N-acetyltransferase n=1 Tax=Oceanicola sp. 502str15 TaxID=2696061 RepID=UPI002095B7CA|nr:GNAT family N-acetyltransferase [Oceanicola sp. 502str15]MCO6384606.1 GNAT family N-acetyltransferase [Oceanicola sp. 502str15]
MTLTITPTRDLDACFALRREVFMGEQGFSETEEFDGKDDAAIHLLACERGEPVGTARVFVDEGRIGRICVVRRARGTGLGARIVRAGMDLLRERGAARAVLDAQVRAMGFYEGLGFAAEGPEFDDGGVPHRRMTCPL